MTFTDLLRFLFAAFTAPNATQTRGEFERTNPGQFYTSTMRRANLRERRCRHTMIVARHNPSP